MDLLENVATELGFEFHLYLVRDELYGAKYAAKNGKFEPSSSFSSSLSSSSRPSETLSAADSAAAVLGSEIYKSEYTEEESPFGSLQSNKDGKRLFARVSRNLKLITQFMIFAWNPPATAHRRYYMNEEKIFGRKNEHIFYKADKEGHMTEFNRDFGYMEKRLREDVLQAARNSHRKRDRVKWNGIIGDLIAGSADMSFAALSVSK